MVNFLVFKSPPEGRTHIFRPGEPMVQIIVIPADSSYEIVPMSEEESAERERQSRRIHASRDTLATSTHWTSTTNTAFDGTYRHLHRAAKAKPEPARRPGSAKRARWRPIRPEKRLWPSVRASSA